MPDRLESIEVGGRTRSYAWHAPADLPTPAALMLVLHGRRLTIPDMKMITRYDAVADRHGFIAVYPEGHQHTWNDGRGSTPAARAEIDDVGFIRRLVDRLVDRNEVDPTRIGATGLSNGAVMCHRLGLELSDRIAAIAPVAGMIPKSLASVTPTHAVSVLLIHGSADRFMSITGGSTRRARVLGLLLRERGLGTGRYLSLAATAARWRAINGCTGETPSDLLPASAGDPTSVERVTSTGCRDRISVEQWIVRGGGHTWPGGPRLLTLGRTTTRFEASEATWGFVAARFLPAADRRLDGAGT